MPNNTISRERSRRTRQRARRSHRLRVRWPVLGLVVFGWLMTGLLLYRIAPGPPILPILLLGLGLFATLVFLGRIDPETTRSATRMGLFLAVCIPVLVAVRAIMHMVVQTASPLQLGALLPLSLAPLLGCVLVGPPFAIVLGLWTAYAAAVMGGNSFALLVLGIAETAAAVQLARHARRRARVIRAGLAIGAVKAAVGLLLWAPAASAGHVLALQTGAAFAVSLAAALAALLLLPLYESVFGLTTDIRLLELSDPGHPLLQRLAEDAPGTYHHSLMLANLAQAAADEIGANSLMVRVCAFFHDVGKLTKPEYFTENTPQGRRPHDDLSPAMSTLIITSHVKEGVGLARHYKLPQPIIDAIQQHHGTSMVSFFFDRARRNKGGDIAGEGVREEDFRYAGPKPMGKEMAILSLADAVEAASRSIDKPTPSRIQNLVEDILWQRLKDGQLDEAELTFRDLSRIRRRFVFTLTNMMHGRVAYPRYDRSPRQSATEGEASEPGASTPDASVAQPRASDHPKLERD